MQLGELIKRLEVEQQNQIVPMGFDSPHSYRGDYYCLAFEPAENISVAEMLKCAKEALNSTFDGYKGGEFEMTEYTDVYLATYGDCGEGIGDILLNYMLGKYSPIQEHKEE